MTERTELSKDVENLDVSYLADSLKGDTSLEGLGEYFVPPVLKKLEANSKPKEIVEEHGAGSIILTGQNACVWKMGDDPFKFVPLLFTPIVRKWKDFNDKPPETLDQTFDMHSEMAKIARSKEKRNAEAYGNGYHYQYVEHLTFLGVIYNGQHAGTQCMLSFERSGHWKGRGFLTAIQSRRIIVNEQRVAQPMWTQVWGINLIPRHNEQGDWHGLNFSNVQPSVIEQQYVEPFQELYSSWKKMQEEKMITYSDESTANDIESKEVPDDGTM